MRVKLRKQGLSYIFRMMLLVAVTFSTLGCSPKTTGEVQEAVSQSQSGQKEDQPTALGQGQTKFTFTCLDPEGQESEFIISTDSQFVGEALQEVGLIEGEEGEFGLYVKTVNGITVDIDTSGMYWAFYEGENYAAKGVDATEIEEGIIYSFRAEK